MINETEVDLARQAMNEAKSGVKALYLQSASLSGLDVSPESPERLAQLTEEGFLKVVPERRPEAVANVLRVIASTLESAQKEGEMTLHRHSVDAGLKDVCPVYPFD
jgi:hypothetical protein